MPEEAIHTKIDFNKSEQYILSIRISTDGFSFSIYNPIRDCSVLSQRRGIEEELSFTANLKQAFRELDFLSYTYKQVNIIFVGKRFTLIPAELFNEEQLDTLFYYNFLPKENEIVLHNELDKNTAVVLFAMDKSVYSLLNERLSGLRFYASVTPFAEHFAVKSRLGGNKKMYVHLHTGFVVVYGYDRGHLMMLNSFGCTNIPDCIYYTLNVWKQLAMDQQKDELQIIAENDDRNDERVKLMSEFQRFIQHVTISKPLNELYLH